VSIHPATLLGFPLFFLLSFFPFSPFSFTAS
jgi:hypothetical protein